MSRRRSNRDWYRWEQHRHSLLCLLLDVYLGFPIGTVYAVRRSKDGRTVFESHTTTRDGQPIQKIKYTNIS